MWLRLAGTTGGHQAHPLSLALGKSLAQDLSGLLQQLWPLLCQVSAAGSLAHHPTSETWWLAADVLAVFTHTLLLWQKFTGMCPQYCQMSLSSCLLSVWEGIKRKPVSSEICLDGTRLFTRCETLVLTLVEGSGGKPHEEQLVQLAGI